MANICVLPEVVQNKIAAGEVVERPASVVKELVENAIDAGATTVIVEIEEGGGNLIRVTDDGAGMSRENLELSIERHATSKIRDIDDIFHIRTLGFRGEALPSIGSVAQLTITTGVAGAAEGWTLEVTGGKKNGVRPAAPRQGTVVEARNLFFNTPARRKFMKSPAAEVAAVSEVLTRLALAHPEIALRLENNGRTGLELPEAATQLDRLTALFGKMALIPVNYQSPQGFAIDGFIAEPPECRAQSRFVYTLLNGRWFRHPGIVRAVADACAGNLPPRRYPFAVLNIVIDTDKVDVNAHPAKEVIRFENEALIVGAAHRAVREALAARHLLGAGVAGDYPDNAIAGTPAPQPVREVPEEYRAPVATFAPLTPPGGKTETFSASAPRYGKFGTMAGAGKNPGLPPSAAFAQPLSAIPRTASTPPVTESPVSAVAEQLAERQWRFLGQAGGKYLVVDTPDGVMFIDQHALHERWNYERLRNRPQTIVRQEMLVPMEFALSPAETAMAEIALPVLREAGFSLELADGENGGKILRITAHPEFVNRRGLEQICRDVLAEEADNGKNLGEELRQRLLARLACRSAVLFGTNLSEELCLDLIDKLLNNYLPTCPHGRPTTVTFAWTELANRFAR